MVLGRTMKPRAGFSGCRTSSQRRYLVLGSSPTATTRSCFGARPLATLTPTPKGLLDNLDLERQQAPAVMYIIPTLIRLWVNLDHLFVRIYGRSVSTHKA